MRSISEMSAAASIASLSLQEYIEPDMLCWYQASIAEANKEVMKMIAAVDKEPQKKGPYLKVTPEYKDQVAKFALINGNCEVF